MAAPPRIDGRDVDAILGQIRALAPFYTPEWAAGEEAGAGAALLKVFVKLLEGLVRRLDEVPRANFVAFLNMLGVRLLPAQPARVPLTFTLSAGAREAAAIPARSQAVANPPDSEPIVFETEQAIVATPARLQALLTALPASDALFDHSAARMGQATTELFQGANLQEHSLYLGHGQLFNLAGKAAVTLTLATTTPGLNENHLKKALSWEWWTGDHWVPSNLAAFKQVLADFPAVTTLDTDLSDDNTSAMSVTDDVESDARFPKSGLLLIDDEVIEYQAKVKNTFATLTRAFPVHGASTAPQHHAERAAVRAIDYPFTFAAPTVTTKRAVGRDAPSVRRQTISLTLRKDFDAKFSKTTVNGIKSFWVRCRSFGEPLAARLPVWNLALDTIRIGGASDGNPPDALFRNDVPLELPGADKPIYPFGRRPRTLDTLYIASNDAFSKPGTAVTLSFALTAGGVADIPVRKVQGIGPTFEARLAAKGITTLDRLLETKAEDLTTHLQTVPIRAQNILEAARKAYYDKVQAGKAAIRAAAVSAAAGQIIESDDDLALSWEYWDGKGWKGLRRRSDGTDKLRGTGDVSFDCPADLAATTVNGQDGYWVRVRIVGGDYGQEEYSVVDGKVVVDASNVRPPVFTGLTVTYAGALENLEACLGYNNLDFVDLTEAAQEPGTSFQPFRPLEDEHQALYLGFDVPPTDGPISIFFSLKEQEYVQGSLPRLEWEYYRLAAGETQGGWARLAVEDGTQELTQSGAVQFLAPDDFVSAQRFGRPFAWIRAVDILDRFRPVAAEISDLIAGRRLSSTGEVEIVRVSRCPSLRPCGEVLESFHPTFSVPTTLLGVAAAPVVQGVYLNTAWAVQAETIQGEILGSGTGVAGQSFTLAKRPVIQEAIWIDELGTLSEGERRSLAESAGADACAVQDAGGNVTGFWLRWRPVADLLEAGSADRVYTIDRTFGLVEFGDGVHGMAPPIGRVNIQATYQAGGGARGNLAAGQITALRTTIPFVDRVMNPEPPGGGSDTELLGAALARGPQILRNRGRAVTAEDFEWLAREASRSIARVKCLPLFNDRGLYKTNWVTVIIVPGSTDLRPVPSPRLRQAVKSYLCARAANVTTAPDHIRVTGPVYVAIGVSADVYPATIDLAPQVTTESLRRIGAFLHPLTGGYENAGWDFGRLPCLSDFYGLLEGIAGVDHVENVTMTLQALAPTGAPLGQPHIVSESRQLNVTMPEYALIFSGDHQIAMKASG